MVRLKIRDLTFRETFTLCWWLFFFRRWRRWWRGFTLLENKQQIKTELFRFASRIIIIFSAGRGLTGVESRRQGDLRAGQ